MLRELDGSVRYFSIREAALVQGFPQDYEFPGIRSRVMGVIGNAVAVDVAAKVGLALVALRSSGETAGSAPDRDQAHEVSSGDLRVSESDAAVAV